MAEWYSEFQQQEWTRRLALDEEARVKREVEKLRSRLDAPTPVEPLLAYTLTPKDIITLIHYGINPEHHG